MAETDGIRDMVDNMIANKPEQAEVRFHDYLQPKMQEILGIRRPGAAEETDDKETD